MDEWVMERYELAKERIAQIPDEKMAEEPYCDFFTKEAMFLQQVIHVMDHGIAGKNLEELQEQNHELYQDILPENYENSYGNPAYAQKMLGEYGKVFTFLYTELYGTIAYAFEKKAWDLTVVLELFLEIYSAFTQEEIPAEKQVKEILVSYVNDYCQDMVENRIREAIDPENNFVVEMIMDSDLSDLSYLYQSGEYVSENELKTAEFMNSLSQREIDEMARTYTEGYRMGFITGRKDITKKKTVNIRYHLGFERMVKAAVLQFRERETSSAGSDVPLLPYASNSPARSHRLPPSCPYGIICESHPESPVSSYLHHPDGFPLLHIQKDISPSASQYPENRLQMHRHSQSSQSLHRT